MTQTGASARYARRGALRAAVFGPGDHERWTFLPAQGASVASGVIADLRDGVMVLDGPLGSQYLATSSATGAWLGARVALSALRPGDPVIVRCGIPDGDPRAPRIAERVWARIGRTAGTIVAADGPELLVDTGHPGRPPQRVVVAASAERQIQVRFPRLAAGYLIDVIGTRDDDHLLAVAPATAQPPYRADRQPEPPLVGGPVPVPVSGSAVWHEREEEPEGLLGLAYPALDEGDAPPPGAGSGCLRLPLLSLGSALRIRNECSGRAAVLPVTGDGALARRFCDRCVTCGTSPKGRLADLTIAAFVELGGNLEKGCFNATVTFESSHPDVRGR